MCVGGGGGGGGVFCPILVLDLILEIFLGNFLDFF